MTLQSTYHYGMFSHKWEDNEPVFEQVILMVVCELEESPTHDKLKVFCKIVRDSGLQWAWSDTCCINKADHFVLEEALVSMLKWYQGSALTVIFLFDVLSPSRHGDMMRSIWNTRARTFQEYHASKVVRFYTKDCTPYMNLHIPNHKKSPEIISEMEEATGVSAKALMALRPGLDDIREKLYLASTRRTTLVEDTAYSLLGIFSISLPVVYGEGNQALGRLLAQLLTSSGDTSILSWTGKSGSFHSCLPTNITVFKQLPPSHIPPVIASTEMDKIIAKLRASSLNLTSVMRLHDRLDEFHVASFSGQRMKLPCLTFQLGAVKATRNAAGRVFRAQTDALGIANIGTEEDLSRVRTLDVLSQGLSVTGHGYVTFVFRLAGWTISRVETLVTPRSSDVIVICLWLITYEFAVVGITQHQIDCIYVLGTSLDRLPWFDRFTVNLECIAEIAYARRAIGSFSSAV